MKRHADHDMLQMLAQGTSATALEASVISGFNTKLLAKISSLKANNTGVSPDNFIALIPSYTDAYGVHR